jgi:hypothetical protein
MSDESPAIDVRLGRIEKDTAQTREKVERLHTEVAGQGQVLRSLEDNSRATATATIELAALARSKDDRERREDERQAKIEEQAAESRQAAVDRLLAGLGENWKYLLLIGVLILQPGAAEVLRAWGLLPSMAAAPTYIINENVPPVVPPPPQPEDPDNADQ